MKTLAAVLILLVVGSAVADEPVKTKTKKVGLKACIAFCMHDGRDGEGVESCYYEEQAVCGLRQKVCVESETRACHPRLVNLGAWNPTFNQYEFSALQQAATR